MWVHSHQGRVFSDQLRIFFSESMHDSRTPKTCFTLDLEWLVVIFLKEKMGAKFVFFLIKTKPGGGAEGRLEKDLSTFLCTLTLAEVRVVLKNSNLRAAVTQPEHQHWGFLF